MLVGKEEREFEFKIELLAQSVELAEPCFSISGKYVSFLYSEDGKGRIIVRGLDDNQWGRRVINFSQFPQPTALYGGGGYTWGLYQGKDCVIIANKKGLWRKSMDCNIPNPMLSIKLNASMPITSPKGRVYFSTLLSNTMALLSVDIKKREWPIQESGNPNFVVDPDVSHDGLFIAWHEWDFPYMAWDKSRIAVKSLNKNKIRFLEWENTSVAQPRWAHSKQKLAFLSDFSGWLNLWLLEDIDEDPHQLVSGEEEHGFPTWIGRIRSFAWLNDDKKIVFTQNKNAIVSLNVVDVESGEISELSLPSGSYSGLYVHPNRPLMLFIYSNYGTPPQIRMYDFEKDQLKVIEQAYPHIGLSSKCIRPTHFSFPTTEKQTAYGIMWRPIKKDIEKAPIIVNAHGGPTSQRLVAWNPQAQFFANRGFLYIELNYRGSTGYGREYAQSLNGYWGERDTEDAISLLSYLDNKGYGDISKSVIMGASAGGFLVLNVLTKYPDVYTGGIALAPVTDLFHLSKATHYFESHYSEMLVGALPDAGEKYRENSPIFHAQKVKKPLLIFQGEDDPVVPIKQVDEFVNIAKQAGAPVFYKKYPGEKHGIKKFENKLNYYEEILDFLEKHILSKNI